MKFRNAILRYFTMIFSLILIAGCGTAPAEVTETENAADESVTSDNAMAGTESDISGFSVSPDVKVVGLGEASHGVAEYQVMKAEVFKALVNNNGCHTFIIEGDFGGCLKVDQYINGGNGSAEEAAGEIGFGIYRTQEMTDLIEWMRSYNESASPEEALHFYGMDVQRFDNNKEFLFSVLEKSDPGLCEEYKTAFSELTDEQRNSLDKDTIEKAEEKLAELIDTMDAMEKDIADVAGQSNFIFARECANTMYSYCDVLTSRNYNDTRDRYMYEKVDWFMQHGDGSVLFINGHNGHIGRSSIAGYNCLGELLAEELGDGYYSIGTDAQETEFNSQMDSGEFEVLTVSNSNDLNELAEGSEDYYFVDFAGAGSDDSWERILGSKQSVVTLNVGLPKMMLNIKTSYTVKIVPKDTYDGMIVFYDVNPTTLLGK